MTAYGGCGVLCVCSSALCMCVCTYVRMYVSMTNFTPVGFQAHYEEFLTSSCMLHVPKISSIYDGESHENLKLHVASGAASFTLLLHRRVSFLHRTATCRPLFKPWVSLLPTYRQSSCVSNFYRTF